jgi:hypothetical protein
MEGRKNMSHFYGIISESARKNAPTARGHHGLTVEAQSWEGKIVTTLTREKDGDYFEVWRKPHHGSGGANVLISKGRLKSFSNAETIIAEGAFNSIDK